MKLSNDNQIMFNIVPLFGAHQQPITGLLFLYEREKTPLQGKSLEIQGE